MQLDINDFYSTTTESTLNEAISFVCLIKNISDGDMRVIKHCTKHFTTSLSTKYFHNIENVFKTLRW